MAQVTTMPTPTGGSTSTRSIDRPKSGITDEEADAIVKQILDANHLSHAGKQQSFRESFEQQADDAVHIFSRIQALSEVDGGSLIPDPTSRLGAYAATRGYPPGTVGDAVHHAIGFIYNVFWTYGEERIGIIFNSPQAKALYNDKADGPSGYKIAQIEYAYWRKTRDEDWTSFGGMAGSAFPTTVRDYLQRNVFGTSAP